MKTLTFCVGNIDNIDSFIPLSVFRLSLFNCDPCLERECSLVNPTSGSGGGRDWGKFVWFETIRLDIILSNIKGVKYGWMVGIFAEASKEDEGEIKQHLEIFRCRYEWTRMRNITVSFW